MKTRNGLTIIAAATLSLVLASAQVQAQPVEPRGQGQGQGQGQSKGQGHGNSQRGQGQEHRQELRESRGQSGERRQQAADEGERREWRRDGEARREGRGDWERERRSGSDGYRDGYRDGPRIDEREIRRFFGERREWIDVDRSRDSLPPGIRMNLERGKPLPPGIAKQFDGRLARDLPRYEGYEWRRVGPDVVLVDMANDLVYEVLRDILY